MTHIWPLSNFINVKFILLKVPSSGFEIFSIIVLNDVASTYKLEKLI